MPRPTTKPDLIKAAKENFDKLGTLIDSMSEHEQTATLFYEEKMKQKEAHWSRDQNVRDVLVHLYEWHQLLLHWVEANQKGHPEPFIPAPYNFKTYGEMNVEFWKKHQSTSLPDAKEMVKKSHADVLDLIDRFTNDELFTKNAFSFTGTSTLGSYCISATSSHYDWALKKLKAYHKAYAMSPK